MGTNIFTMRATLMGLLLVPRNVAVAILLAYRKVISPLYGEVCRYYPSCSLYALRAIQYHGALWGIGLGIIRILRCNPFARGGIDDPPERFKTTYEETPRGFVKVKES
jgi:putative membrane protein insertion efficiency factor